jgi:hypothetical protein
MFETVAVILAGVILAGMVLAGRYRPEWFGDPPPAHRRQEPPSALESGSFVLDTRGRGVACGASVLVNGVELNSVVADVDILAAPGELPRVTLSVVPVDGLVVQLERADIRVDTRYIRETLELLKPRGGV